VDGAEMEELEWNFSPPGLRGSQGDPGRSRRWTCPTLVAFPSLCVLLVVRSLGKLAGVFPCGRLPLHTEVGDAVCVVEGVRAPLTLRRVDSPLTLRYQLVGGNFVLNLKVFSATSRLDSVGE